MDAKPPPPLAKATSQALASLEPRTVVAAASALALSSSCLVCFGDLRYAGRTPCHHDEICGTCHLRLRQLHKDLKCPICKAVHEHIIVDSTAASSNTNKVFEDYPLWGDDLGGDFVLAHGLFFPVSYFYTTIQPLLSYYCSVKDCGFGTNTTAGNTNLTMEEGISSKTNSHNNTLHNKTTLRGLQDHLRTVHRLTLCQLCVDFQRDFVARLPRYSPSGLGKHVESLTGAGHPVCEFCRPTRFYDITALHVHLNHDHYKCHVCETALNLPNQFFKHYTSLERHFDQRHFLCKHSQCLAARFVVFANELDLRAHERQVHGTNHQSTKLQLEFRMVRSSGHPQPQQPSQQQPLSDSDFDYAVDGTPFVPAAIATVQEHSTLHPAHVARTLELRERAEALRVVDDDTATAAFPTLQAAAAAATNDANGLPSLATNNRLTIGWTADGTIQRLARQHRPAGAVTEEDFPSLSGGRPRPTAAASAANNIANLTRLAKKPPPQPRTAAAAATAQWTAAAASTTTPRVVTPSSAPAFRQSMATTATTSTAPLDLSASNFPSLSGRAARSNDTNSSLYGAAQAYSQTLNARTTAPMSHVAADNFPALKPAPPSRQSTKKAAADLSVDQFPALGRSAATKTSSNPRPAATTNHNPYASAEALAQKQARERALNAAPSATDWGATGSSGTATTTDASVRDVKAALGPAAYKLLKKFTREFANGELAADAYIDHAASLFARGYSDRDFWQFVPALVASCPPSTADKDGAHRYLDHLKRMRNGALNAESVQAAAAAAASAVDPSAATSTTARGGWSSTPSTATMPTAPTPSFPSGQSIPLGRYVPPPPPPVSHGRLSTTQLKNNAWGSSAATAPPSSVLSAKPASALSVAAAAAPTTRGTATSFMAKEAKQEQWQQSNKSNAAGGKKKGKQKNELRALAFGA
jgi:E3 ubiquitin-protein ligase ZNF598